jgi:hypothetical protein
VADAAARTGITFEQVQTEYYPVATGFRPQTPMFPIKLGVLLFNGGLGDYLTWLRPAQWLCQEATWIHGKFFMPEYLQEVGKYFLGRYKNATVQTYKDLESIPKTSDMPLRGPLILQNESLNATGAHLMTCGWVYFTNKEKAPAHNDEDGLPWHHYPKFKQSDLDAMELPEMARALKPRTYAVVTTGVTTPSRNVKPEYWNHVIEHVRAQGLTPVFLGKRVTTTGNLKNIHTTYSKDLRMDLGVDLLDQTTLMQAASIMSRAAYVVGHDNGLLHLAGCTEVPIVFSYNLASPEHRRPIRTVGRTYDVTLTKDELACIHCQSNCNFVIGYSFTKCFYGDLKCIDMIFANKAEKFKEAMERAYGEVRLDDWHSLLSARNGSFKFDENTRR